MKKRYRNNFLFLPNLNVNFWYINYESICYTIYIKKVNY